MGPPTQPNPKQHAHARGAEAVTQTDQAAAPDSGKYAVKKPNRSRKSLFEWPDVVRCLQDPKARQVALDHFKTAEFKPDDVARSKTAQIAACAALTRAEDWLELNHPGEKPPGLRSSVPVGAWSCSVLNERNQC